MEVLELLAKEILEVLKFLVMEMEAEAEVQHLLVLQEVLVLKEEQDLFHQLLVHLFIILLAEAADGEHLVDG
jgi:hypothetical protein